MATAIPEWGFWSTVPGTAEWYKRKRWEAEVASQTWTEAGELVVEVGEEAADIARRVAEDAAKAALDRVIIGSLLGLFVVTATAGVAVYMIKD